MPDAIFAHPRLAEVYDAFDGPRDDLVAYRDIVDELGADRVLDVGCGTGNLAVLLAGRARTVVGVDPAEASLAVAKTKDSAGRITWLHGDATTLPDLAVDLAVMTGNVAQVFLADDDWARTLDGVVLNSDSTLRLPDREEVAASLADRCFRVLDVRDAPDRPGREFVFIAGTAPAG